MHRLDLGLYSHPKEFFFLGGGGGGMEFEPMLTPREKSPLPKMSPEEDRTCDAMDSEPKHIRDISQWLSSGLVAMVVGAACCLRKAVFRATGRPSSCSFKSGTPHEARTPAPTTKTPVPTTVNRHKQQQQQPFS